MWTSLCKIGLWIVLILSAASVTRNIAAEGPAADTSGEHQTLRAGVKKALDQGGWSAALASLREFEQIATPGTDTSSELLMISMAAFDKKDYQQSLDLLQEVTKRFPGSESEPMAHCVLGVVYQELGDEPKMIAAYETAAGLRPVDAARRFSDTGDAYNGAMVGLASHYMRKQNWQRAMDYLIAWKPNSECGICVVIMQFTKQEYTYACLRLSGKHQAAAKYCFDTLKSGGDSDFAAYLFELYQDAAQLDDLRRIAQQIEAIEFPEYREREDLHGRPDEEVRKEMPSWAIQELLQSVPLIEQAIQADPKNSQRLLSALGINRSPEALQALQELARAVETHERTRAETLYDLDALMSAIAGHGDAGEKVLKQLSAGSSSEVQQAAKNQLGRKNQADEPGGLGIALPPLARPAAGSLPKNLKELQAQASIVPQPEAAPASDAPNR
jgi:tetratricopeptide (TPR) repeat protein